MAAGAEHWVFLSHIHEDAALAEWLKQRLERDFLEKLGVYVSSEAPPGANWFEGIDAHLEKSEMLLALCSPASIRRPWLNFEVGAAWARGKRVIPLCHNGLAPEDLER